MVRVLPPVALASILIVLALAGCAGKSPSSSAPSAFDDLGDDVEVTQTRGAIAGVVVDPAVRPVPNATIELVGKNVNATSDSQGRFVFESLEPATYFLKATARRFEGAQVSAEVVAGAPTTVKVLLVPLTSAEPYHTTLQYRGHIDEYLGEANFAAEDFAPGTVPCTCAWTFTVDPKLESIVFEAAGTVTIENPGTPATVDGDAYWELIADGGQGEIKSSYDDFPFSYHFDNGSYDDPGNSYLARVTGGVWPSGTMDYDLFITLWYHEPAPESWSILNGDV